jgi:tetrapyrrole methylase family protein/MazG family protein
MTKKYSFDEIVAIIALLRSEKGCPWDREQTHESLKKYLIEETYETLDAIDKGDPAKICDELGDILLQVLLHAQISAEAGQFDIGDVISGSAAKMVQRHTHIFGEDVAETSEDVMKNWEKNKKKEKGISTYGGVLRDIPANLPALIRAYKVQQKASRPGVDFAKIDDVFAKIEEELAELKAARLEGDAGRIEEELGDVMFSIVNLSRFLDLHPELTLTGATEKFMKRFEFVEKEAAAANRQLEDLSPEELDVFWEKSK